MGDQRGENGDRLQWWRDFIVSQDYGQTIVHSFKRGSQGGARVPVPTWDQKTIPPGQG